MGLVVFEASLIVGRLLDHRLDVGPATLIAQDADVLEAHQRLDLTRVDEDEGFLPLWLTPQA